MRLLFSTVVALIVSACLFFIVKFWGLSQVFIDYKHPFLEVESNPLQFIKPDDGWSIMSTELQQYRFLYLDLAVTQEGHGVVLRKAIEKVRMRHLKDISEDVYTAEQIKDFLQDKKIIFNFTENPIAGPEIIIEFISKINFINSRNFLIVSDLEIPLKFLKEKQPTFLFGSTKPEILRLKALESIWLIEAATFRADVIVHPLRYYHRNFYSQVLITELERRHRPFIIGPMTKQEYQADKEILDEKKPFGIIIEH